jgi:hypothetical protein
MFNMINEKDIYAHLSKGGDPQVLFDAFLQELNAAQQKVDAEKEKKKKAEAEAAAKKAAEKEAKAKKEEARKVAIAAAASYYALVYPEFSGEDLDTFAKTAIDSVAKSIELVKKLESGQCTSIFDIFE